MLSQRLRDSHKKTKVGTLYIHEQSLFATHPTNLREKQARLWDVYSDNPIFTSDQSYR